MNFLLITEGSFLNTFAMSTNLDFDLNNSIISLVCLSVDLVRTKQESEVTEEESYSLSEKEGADEFLNEDIENREEVDPEVADKIGKEMVNPRELGGNVEGTADDEDEMSEMKIESDISKKALKE